MAFGHAGCVMVILSNNLRRLPFPLFARRAGLSTRFFSTKSDASTTGGQGNVMATVWRRYLTITDAHPIKTQAITTIIFAGLGNILAQTVVERRPLSDLDLPSLLKFTTISLCYTFPVVRTWLWTLERVVKPSKYAPLKKVALDQFCFAPISLAAFLCVMQFVEGNGWDGAKRNVEQNWWPVLMNNYKLWPAAQLINFYLVPFNQRILFGSAVSLLWNTYIAFVVRQGTAAPVAAAPVAIPQKEA
ncbi:hypothetical protein RvY_13929 [Ramazzottius varieornatus]|uniref:Mitochondrial inner membrane protein Mpv17 n=1 Tax=Ramazzottius varieornatus TaxID=947166 RepID=A0A1D1VPK9_RAMVA|nr:hypothetical protein RvY_13929 [Ramazzottius varieornatus]